MYNTKSRVFCLTVIMIEQVFFSPVRYVDKSIHACWQMTSMRWLFRQPDSGLRN